MKKQRLRITAMIVLRVMMTSLADLESRILGQDHTIWEHRSGINCDKVLSTDRALHCAKVGPTGVTVQPIWAVHARSGIGYGDPERIGAATHPAMNVIEIDSTKLAGAEDRPGNQRGPRPARRSTAEIIFPYSRAKPDVSLGVVVVGRNIWMQAG